MQHSKSGLFLMEMIIAILFFSLASTVCIQLFAKSHLISEQTVAQSHAVLQAQNLAELFIAAEGDIVQMQQFHAVEYSSDIPETDSAFPQYSLYFDHNWNECSESFAAYKATLVVQSEKDGLRTADITVSDTKSDSGILYTLTVSHHIPKRRGNIHE